MSFFDQIIDTPDYQAKVLAGNQPNAMGGLPSMAPMQPSPPIPQTPTPGLPGMQPQGFAKGGLAGANKAIEQTQIMKVFEHYFRNLGVDVKKGMNDLLKEIAQGLQLVPFESSVMGFKPLDGSTAQIHFFTVGTLKDLTDDMQYFFKYLKNKDIRTVYDTLPAPITTQMLVKLGAKVEQSDNPKYKLKATI
jgi:hypothetical protein